MRDVDAAMKSWAKDVALATACVAVVAAAYLRTLSFPHLAEWYVAHAPGCVARGAWAHLLNPIGTYYRPAMSLLQEAVCTSSQEPLPARDRAFIVALHLACVALLFARLRQNVASPAVAATVAVAFGLHPSLAPVVTQSTAWISSLAGALSLLAAIAYEIVGASRSMSGGSRWCLSTVAAGLVLLQCLVVETGVCAATALVIGLALRTRHLGRSVWMTAVGPGAAALLIYAGLRAIAMGPRVLSPLVGRPSGLVELLLAWARGLQYEIAVLASPLMLPSAALGVACGLGVAGLAMASTRVGGLARRHPVTAVGLALHAIVQMNSNWLILLEPVDRQGIQRSAHQYLPAILLAFPVADVLTVAFAHWSRQGRVVLGVALAAWLSASTLLQQRAVALAHRGSEILRADAALLTPFLRDLHPGSEVLPYGFPEVLREPHVAEAWVYVSSRHAIFSRWAGKPIHVRHVTGDYAPAEGFRGFIVTRQADGATWAWQDPEMAREGYISRHSSHAPTARLLTLNVLGRSHGIEAARSAPTELAARASNADPWMTISVNATPAAYGVLRYEIACTGSERQHTQVYFRAEHDIFHESRSAARTLACDGNWQEVRFPLFADPRWAASHHIAEIRIDPVDQPGPFALRAVRLENDLDWARRWTAP